MSRKLVQLKLIKNAITNGFYDNNENEQAAQKPVGVIANSKKIKKFHLTQDQLKEKIDKLENKVKTLSGTENLKKRKNIFSELAKLNKALSDPDAYLVDPLEEQTKLKDDKQKRVQKKLKKKKEQIQAEKRKKRFQNSKCLNCQEIGHIIKDCPNLGSKEIHSICYNCGETTHTLKMCQKPINYPLKYAKCFVCQETGHLSRECPKK